MILLRIVDKDQQCNVDANIDIFYTLQFRAAAVLYSRPIAETVVILIQEEQFMLERSFPM